VAYIQVLLSFIRQDGRKKSTTVLNLDIRYSYRAPPSCKSGVAASANLRGFRYVSCSVSAKTFNQQNSLAKADLDTSSAV
jgi:hypothetical protein